MHTCMLYNCIITYVHGHAWMKSVYLVNQKGYEIINFANIKDTLNIKIELIHLYGHMV